MISDAPIRSLAYSILSVVSLSLFASSPALAETSSPPLPTTVPSLGLGSGITRTPDVTVQETPPGVQRLLLQLVQENIPPTYERDKEWGGTKEVWAGVEVKLDGLDLHTRRKKKTVNHGTWKRYAIALVDPDEYLKVRLENVHESQPGQLAFDLILSAKLDATGRVQRWNRGLRIWSVSADAQILLEIQLACQLGTKLDTSRLPPDILLEPVVTEAQLRLEDFELKRVSQADGPVIREVGDGLESVVRKQMEKREEKLVAKINQAIEKHRDDLRISLADWLTKKGSAESRPVPAAQ